MKLNIMKKLAILALITISAFSFAACSTTEESTETATTENEVATLDEPATEEPSTDEAVATETTDANPIIGEGEKSFTFEVNFEDETTSVYDVKTDATTVGEALLAAGVIAGDDSEYGLYVKTVDGVTIDPDTEGKYWAFYIDGEMAPTGVDSTEIVEGSVYTFTVEAF